MVKKSIDRQVLASWLSNAKNQLESIGITCALLDTELILAYTLNKSRTYLQANGVRARA